MSRRPHRGHRRQPQRHKPHASVGQTFASTFLGTPKRFLLTFAVLVAVFAALAPNLAGNMLNNAVMVFVHAFGPALGPILTIVIIGIGAMIVWKGFRK